MRRRSRKVWRGLLGVGGEKRLDSWLDALVDPIHKLFGPAMFAEKRRTCKNVLSSNDCDKASKWSKDMSTK